MSRKMSTYQTLMLNLMKWIPAPAPAREAAEPFALDCLPCDIYLHISQFLNFEDYRNFIKAVFPNGDEDHLIKKRLWEMSTYKCESSFFNEKQVVIEYNYDSKRKNRILLNVESVLPVTGNIFPESYKEFASPLEIYDIVWSHFNMDQCEEYLFASCNCDRGKDTPAIYPDTFGELSGSECEHEHFHHFCKHHVCWWLKYYLRQCIYLQEPKAPQVRPTVVCRNFFENMLIKCWCIKL